LHFVWGVSPADTLLCVVKMFNVDLQGVTLEQQTPASRSSGFCHASKGVRMRFVVVIISLITCVCSALAQESELSVRAQIQRQLPELFLQKNFDQLNRWAEYYRTTEERTPSGV